MVASSDGGCTYFTAGFACTMFAGLDRVLFAVAAAIAAAAAAAACKVEDLCGVHFVAVTEDVGCRSSDCCSL